MAAKLQCEICGGKLIGRPGGVFECEYCGTEYSTEWARAKIQEITGTVKVEGTVEVTGKVQVDGPIKVDSSANIEALLQRGNLALEDCNWSKARDIFDQVLDMAPQCADAYLGLAMEEERCRDRNAFLRKYIAADSELRLSGNTNFKRAIQFSSKVADWAAKMDEEGQEADRLVPNSLEPIRKKLAAFSRMISAGCLHSVGVSVEGNTVATTFFGNPKMYDNQCDVFRWKNIVGVAAGEYHTLGLKENGTVIAVGQNNYGQCNVYGWKNIVDIAAGSGHSLGLNADGTVVATGENSHGRCSVSGWKSIVSIAAGSNHSLGLRADGTVVAVGDNSHGQCDVSEWRNIVNIAAGGYYSVGLKADGTVVATNYTGNQVLNKGQCEVSGWKSIVSIAAGNNFTLGLKSDGTVIATGSNNSGECEVSQWTDIISIAAGVAHSIGLKTDGTVVAQGGNTYGQSSVSGWKLFDNIEMVGIKYEAVRKFAADRAEAERKVKIETLTKEKAQLETELPSIRGMFAGSKKAKLEARLKEIESEIETLV